jgi:hypothetical protein
MYITNPFLYFSLRDDGEDGRKVAGTVIVIYHISGKNSIILNTDSHREVAKIFWAKPMSAFVNNIREMVV